MGAEILQYYPSLCEKLSDSISTYKVGLHGTSDNRAGMIPLNGFDSSQIPENRDPRFTYYALMDPLQMRKDTIHPLFFLHTINLAMTFAADACEKDRQKGIHSKPVLIVLANPEPESTASEYKLTPKLLLVCVEAREAHESLRGKIVGKIQGAHEQDNEGMLRDYLRIMENLISICSAGLRQLPRERA